MANRVIVLIDMDCFYAQVEQKLNPEIQGKPCAVVQYKPWKGGGIIAVNYEARSAGITRNMFGDEAKNLCPEIHLARVPELRGKADLTRYRDASKDVFAVLTQFSEFVERASIDEAYIDLTSEVQKRMKLSSSERVRAESFVNTHVVGLESESDDGLRFEGVKLWLLEVFDECLPDVLNQQLAIAAEMVEGIRAAVFEGTGFHCSAGIAHNKMLAKLACGMNKPKKQTVVPQSSIPGLFSHLSLKKVRNLGGKLGDCLVDSFNCKTMQDLSKITQKQLESYFGEKVGSWLFDLGRGIEHETVTPRQLPKSIGCSKNFAGKSALKKSDEIKHWVDQLAIEVVERLANDLQANKRMAKVLTVSLRFGGKEPNNITRSCPIQLYDTEKIANDVMALLSKHNKGTGGEWFPPVYCLGVSAGRFQDHVEANMANIKSFFHKEMTNNEISCSNSSETATETPAKGFFASKMEEFERKSVENCEESNCGSIGAPEMSDKSSGIKKFFGNSTAKGGEASCSYAVPVPDDCFRCEDCGKMISVWDSVEHSDYHLAIKLQSELKLEQRVPGSIVRKITPPSATKRKDSKRKNSTQTARKSSKKTDSEPEPKIRKIETFFQKI